MVRRTRGVGVDEQMARPSGRAGVWAVRSEEQRRKKERKKARKKERKKVDDEERRKRRRRRRRRRRDGVSTTIDTAKERLFQTIRIRPEGENQRGRPRGWSWGHGCFVLTLPVLSSVLL